MRRAWLLEVGILLAVPSACNPFAPDQSVVLEVESLDAPATIAPGASLTVILTVTTGGCTVFDRIAVLRRTSEAQLAAIGLNTAKGGTNYSCPTDVRSDAHSYTLDPPFQSPFTVQVNRPTSPPLLELWRWNRLESEAGQTTAKL